MDRFITLIADPELELNVLKAIKQVNGKLVLRGVSLEQVQEIENKHELTLVTTRSIDFPGRLILVDKSLKLEDLISLMQPIESPTKLKNRITFNKGANKVISFLGLSAGVGTTSIALNFAFEKSQEQKVRLIDLNTEHPDIATALGLHHIESRCERITNYLEVCQGLPEQVGEFTYVFDLGTDSESPILQVSDEIYVVTRTSFNTISRLRAMRFNPTAALFNFAERSKIQEKWRMQIVEEFPRLYCINIPLDQKAFEMAAEARSALLEVAPNSPARKSIANLG